jgi:hypothetical protein
MVSGQRDRAEALLLDLDGVLHVFDPRSPPRWSATTSTLDSDLEKLGLTDEFDVVVNSPIARPHGHEAHPSLARSRPRRYPKLPPAALGTEVAPTRRYVPDRMCGRSARI